MKRKSVSDTQTPSGITSSKAAARTASLSFGKRLAKAFERRKKERANGDYDSVAEVPTDFKLAPECQKKLVNEITEAISSRVRNRADEVLEEPGRYGPTINEIRWQITACIADDLNHDLGDYLEEILTAGWPENSGGSPTRNR